jgi:signal peptidase II
MTGYSKRLWLAFWLIGAAIVADQSTKWLAVSFLRRHPPISYLANLFRLEYSENPGAFLSLGDSLSGEARFWLLSVAVAFSLAGLFVYTIFFSNFSRIQLVGTLLLIGGGTSNLFDRLLRPNGQVVDFMNMGIDGLLPRTGVFNVADVLIMAGVALIVFFPPKARKEHRS